ncbi:sensor histidine kinase [Ornithinibacillus californiensis]|uniref:sensor histidine kinase n=1 Tax=Ornithinibacillus californiensis TaxID=161536 RepID=UPI000A8A9AF9|nr:sensor histidine kinase [Ornithinibacillus californiensis]
MGKITLQTKILVLIIGLIILITASLTGIVAYYESKEIEKHIGERALNAAITISLMPTVIDAFEHENPTGVLQPIAEEIREIIGAEFIVIGNANSIRYAHPDTGKIGKKMVGGDNDRALISGETYTSKAVGSLGPSLRGKAPVINEDGEIIGIISVGFMLDDIQSIIYNNLLKFSGSAIPIILLGIFGSVMLARNIRKDTFGLEPHQIASLFQDRSAILSSVKEGIVAVGADGRVTMMNESAQKILGLSNNYMNQRIEEVFPNTKMYDVLNSGSAIKDDEVVLNNRPVIVNRTPILNDKSQVVGVVASFRDKTEINEMLNTLSEVRKYSEDLRAQTHEYTNKLYVLSGLLQLGHYKEAIELIQIESSATVQVNKILLEQIKDQTIQAILLGKIGKSSEKKVEFRIDTNSYLEELPSHIDVAKLITIVGNLLDNALEAVEKKEKREIVFFVTDLGDDIVFEIADSGDGIPGQDTYRIFERGYSTKREKGRGYGLAIVTETIGELGGQIEVHNPPDGGAIFSVFIPKQSK